MRAWVLLIAAACGDNHAGPIDARVPIDQPSDAPAGPTFHQIEHLARPGVAELLLLDDPLLVGWNQTAPTMTGVSTTQLHGIVDQMKQILSALYLGTCLIDGRLGLTATTGLQPGGETCAAVGDAVFLGDGETVAPAVKLAAAGYADRVFAQLFPDVMRIDTAAPSGYETLCSAIENRSMLWCGGRGLRDDVVDITYDYLLDGGATCTRGHCGVPDQFNALVSDGVVYGNAGNVGSRANGDPANPNQGHPDVTATFPYAAPPI